MLHACGHVVSCDDVIVVVLDACKQACCVVKLSRCHVVKLSCCHVVMLDDVTV